MAGRPPDPPEAIATQLKAFLFGGVGLNDRQLARIYQNITDFVVGAIVSERIPNDIIVMTYVDDGRNIEFAKSFPGPTSLGAIGIIAQTIRRNANY